MLILRGNNKTKNPSEKDFEYEFNNLQYGMCEFLSLEFQNRVLQIYSDEEIFPAKTFFIEYLPGDAVYKHKAPVSRKNAMKFLRTFRDFEKIDIDDDWEKSPLPAPTNIWQISMSRKSFVPGLLVLSAVILILSIFAAYMSNLPLVNGVKIALLVLPYLLGIVVFSHFYFGKWVARFISWLSVKIAMPSEAGGRLNEIRLLAGVPKSSSKKFFLELMLFFSVMFGVVAVLLWLLLFVLTVSFLKIFG